MRTLTTEEREKLLARYRERAKPPNPNYPMSYPLELEAHRRLAAGELPNCSTGICDGLSYGYGRLDSNGYWEFPLFLRSED
jgi:hypothetical protein